MKKKNAAGGGTLSEGIQGRPMTADLSPERQHECSRQLSLGGWVYSLAVIGGLCHFVSVEDTAIFATSCITRHVVSIWRGDILIMLRLLP